MGFLTLLSAIILQVQGQQEIPDTLKTVETPATIDTSQITKVVVGEGLITIEEKPDEVTVKIGDTKIRVLDSLESKRPRIKIEKEIEETADCIDDDEDIEKKDSDCRHGRFKGYWSGLEFGLNNYVTSDGSMSLPDDIDYMSLHSGKSKSFSLNISQHCIGITRHIGFITGIGIGWNNFFFSGDNNIQKGTNGVIEILDPGTTLDKSKLTVVYLNVPLLFEVQVPSDHKYFNMSAGLIGGVKVGSHSKMVLENGDKIKSKDDFSLSMFRYGATARAGYSNFHVFGTYYFSPLFKSANSPGGNDLYPFEVGIAISFND